ncbi:Integral membrane protein [Phycisphaerae bacterium RAS1]|nr:Integral membrane protein [Phycisphaerae bacterium RAS1]
MPANPSPLTVFGRDHVGVLLAVASVAAALCLVLRAVGRTPGDAGVNLRRALCGGLAALLVVNDVSGTAGELTRGVFDIRTSLPLHLCDLAVYATAWALVESSRARPRPAAFELAYYWGLAGTSQGLITPEITDPFPTPEFFHFFIMHGGIVVAVLAMTFGLGLRPRPGSATRCFVITIFAAVPVAAADWLLDANYMYLCGPPKRASLYDYFGPWPLSLLTMGAVGWLMMAACYAPIGVSRAIRTAHCPREETR